jgi:hypothetical protein
LLINDTNKRYAIGASGAAEEEVTGAVSVTLAAYFFDLQEIHAKLINEAKKNNCFICRYLLFFIDIWYTPCIFIGVCAFRHMAISYVDSVGFYLPFGIVMLTSFLFVPLAT